MSGRGLRSARISRVSVEALGDELTHVLDLERPLRLLHLAAEVHHREAERTARADDVRLRLEDLLDADQVDTLLGLHLHPHVAAPAATAEAARAAPRQLDDSEPRHRAGHAAGRFPDPVVAAEIAGVVERERRVERLRSPAPPRANQPV